MSDEQNSLIVGAQAGLRVMVDGGVRLTIDVEPKDRVAAMTLFGAPGQPIALAALKVGYAAASAKPRVARTWADKGPLEKEAIELCQSPKFQEYISRSELEQRWKPTADAARGCILATCGVDSRQDLDTTPGARELFIAHVRKPYLAWVASQAK